MKDKQFLHNLLLHSVFAVYMIILFSLLLFRARHSFRAINLVPFRGIVDFISSAGAGSDAIVRSFAISNILGNIILFVPLGIYLSLFVRNKNLFSETFCIFCVSMCVEIIQYIFKVGICDIDDVILNCFGGFAGAVFYRALTFFAKGENNARRFVEISAPVGGIISFLILLFYNAGA